MLVVWFGGTRAPRVGHSRRARAVSGPSRSVFFCQRRTGVVFPGVEVASQTHRHWLSREIKTNATSGRWLVGQVCAKIAVGEFGHKNMQGAEKHTRRPAGGWPSLFCCCVFHLAQFGNRVLYVCLLFFPSRPLSPAFPHDSQIRDWSVRG